MFEANITHGPDRFSILMALGSCYEDRPGTPEFTVSTTGDSGKSVGLKIRLRIQSVDHESGTTGMYLIKGWVAQYNSAPKPDYDEYRMYYDANGRKGHVTFMKFGEKNA